jgi:hypothetical protein
MWSVAPGAQARARATYTALGGVKGLLGEYLDKVPDCRHTEFQRRLVIECLLALVDDPLTTVRAGRLSLTDIRKKLPDRLQSQKKAVSETLEFLSGKNVRLVVTDDLATSK